MTSEFHYEPRARKAETKQASITGLVHKEGSWVAWEKERIVALIAAAYKSYGEALEQQASFLHSNLELHFGRRMQVFIYERTAIEGHALFAVSGKFLEVQHEEFMYVVWKVKLIEDIPDEKEY